MLSTPRIFHRHARWAVVLAALFFTPSVALTAWAAALLLTHREAVATLSTAAALAIALWVVVRAWTERLEVHPDHLVYWRGRHGAHIALEQIVDVDLVWFDATRAFQPEQPVTVTLRREGTDAIEFSTKYGAVQPALDTIVGALASRMRHRLQRGETLTFRDANPFPLTAVLALAFFVFMMGLGVVLAFTDRAHYRYGQFGGVGAALSTFGVYAFASLRTWWKARQHRGVALSADGIRPLTKSPTDATGLVGYRGAAVDPSSWIPWSAVVSARLDGSGIELQTNVLARPIVLSSKTSGSAALHRLVQQEMTRHASAVAPAARAAPTPFG